ncbi:response regulator transcription factor [Nonomuraea sp. NPDC050404]|uniref:response regulator transcription factor n=1 Tax=Nonomuraea sp. NPDC050404 TaxID=3155783 RepID=UPI0033FE1BB7
MIRVLLVDDQILMREGLRKLLEIEPGIEVAATVGGGEEALSWLAGVPDGEGPRVALVDARMPGMDGVELVARMSAEFPEVAPVILSTFDDDDYIFGGLRAGAKGYLLKDIPPDELVSAIRRAARGETVLGGAASERLVGLLRETLDPAAPTQGPLAQGALAQGLPVQGPPGGLSEREHEIALLIGSGAANREIARRLHITEGTVKNHISSCLRKLGLRDRTQLAVWVAKTRA